MHQRGSTNPMLDKLWLAGKEQYVEN
jgi:hypothetical protein